MLRWVCQRHLEILLYGRSDGGSSGPIWKLLNVSGLGSTSLLCNRKAVNDGVLQDDEFTRIMAVFKQSLPIDIADPSSTGRIRGCTLLPLATAALVCRQYGRSPASLAWLRAFAQPVPDSWLLHEQAETDAANLELDLLLMEKLDDQSFEVEGLSFREELTSMPAFQSVPDDEERLKTYILQRVPASLKKELDEYIGHRTATFAARRQGGAVQSISAEADRTQLLRFFGYLERLDRIPAGQMIGITLMIRTDLGDLVSEYATWLQNTQHCRFSSIANYLNGLISITTYCYSNLAPTDAVLNMEPNPLSQLINLRGQAEKASKTQQLYDKRVGGWCEWPDVQKARVASIEKLKEVTSGTPAARNALRDAAALSLLSLIPPDRVGCIRKLRLGHTLKKKEGGGWMMDLSKQRDGHKTSRFYGPFAASLPSALTPILNQYEHVFSLEPDGHSAYLFHPPQSGFDRPMESSAWTGWVKRLFKRHHGEEIAPKTLRSVFITWLRDNTSAPEILKSAAHCMKHSEQRQASSDYDQESDDRLVRAAYDFNLQFAANFQANVGADAGGSSADQSAVPAASSGADDQLPALPPASVSVVEAEESAAVEEGWHVLEGGPWIAKLMRPSRQPVAHANYRNFYLPLPFDPAITPLCPAGELKIPIVAGAPADGLVLKLPSGWSGTTRELVFKLKLNKAAATESSVTINQIFYRNPNVDADSEDSDGMLVDERSDGEAASMPASGDGSMAARAAALLSMPDEPRASGETDVRRARDGSLRIARPLRRPRSTSTTNNRPRPQTT